MQKRKNKIANERDFQTFSNGAYDINKENTKIKEGSLLNSSSRDFKILSVENNKDNGMQATAVAPVDSNGEVDTKQIEILKLNKQIKRV